MWNRLALLGVVLLGLTSPAHAIKISELDEGAALSGDEIAAYVQDGVTVQITAEQIQDYILDDLAIADNNIAATGTDQGVSFAVSGDPTISYEFDVGAGNSGFPLINWITDGEGAGAPVYRWIHDTTTPANSDTIANFSFLLTNSALTRHEFASMQAQANDVTDGSEDGQLEFATYVNGTSANKLVIDDEVTLSADLIIENDSVVVGHTATIGTYLTNGGSEATPLVQIHTIGAPLAISHWGNSSGGANLMISKSRSAFGIGTFTVVQDDDRFGCINFQGADGDDFSIGAAICAAVDGTPGDGDMPGRVEIYTTGDGGGNTVSARRWYWDADGHYIPNTDAAADIGTTALGINDVHFGLAGVINFDGGDVTLTHTANFLTFNGGDLVLDNEAELQFAEAAGNGDHYKAFVAPASISADTTCTFEDDTHFIPITCVDDGVDDTSDARLKTNAVLLSPGKVGGMLDAIKIYDFEWAVDAPEVAEKIQKGEHGVGPMAQELYEVAPDLVKVGGEDALKQPWRFHADRLVPYLLVEIQSLRARVLELEGNSLQ